MSNNMRANFQPRSRNKNVSFRSDEDEFVYDHRAPNRDREAHLKTERDDGRSVQLLPDANMKISVSNDFRESRNSRNKDERIVIQSDHFRDDSNFYSNNFRNNNYSNRGYDMRGRGGRGARGVYNRDSSGFHDQSNDNGYDNHQRNNRGRPMSGNYDYDTEGSRESNRRSFPDRQSSGGYDQAYDRNYAPKNFNQRRTPGNFDREQFNNRGQSFPQSGYRGRGNAGNDYPKMSRGGRSRGRGHTGRSGEDGTESSAYFDGDKRSSQEESNRKKSDKREWLEDESDEPRRSQDGVQARDSAVNDRSDIPTKSNNEGEWLEDEDPPCQDRVDANCCDKESSTMKDSARTTECPSENNDCSSVKVDDNETESGDTGDTLGRSPVENRESKETEERDVAHSKEGDCGTEIVSEESERQENCPTEINEARETEKGIDDSSVPIGALKEEDKDCSRSVNMSGTEELGSSVAHTYDQREKEAEDVSGTRNRGISELTCEESVMPRDDSAVSRDDSTVPRDNRAVSHEESAVSRDYSTVPRDDSAVSRDDSTVQRDDSAVSRDDSTVPRDDSAVSRDDSTVPRDDSAVSRDESAVSRDDSAESRDNSTVPHDDAHPEQGNGDCVSVQVGTSGDQGSEETCAESLDKTG